MKIKLNKTQILEEYGSINMNNNSLGMRRNSMGNTLINSTVRPSSGYSSGKEELKGDAKKLATGIGATAVGVTGAITGGKHIIDSLVDKSDDVV